MIYKIKSFSRSRHIRIIVKRGGEVIITKPRHVPTRLAEEFFRRSYDWIEKKLALVESGKKQPAPAEFLADRDRAEEIFKNKVEKINSFYKFFYKKISVRNNSSRLGSCSRSGNLSFSYSLINMPEETIDYVVAHELCHLKEFNHSERFWALVSKTIPDYKIIRKKIRASWF